MVKRIILITVCVLLSCALIFAMFIGAFLCYWVWDWEMTQDSLEKTPEDAGLSEWESDTSPRITFHIPDAGGNYCTIAENEYYVDFISKRKWKNIVFYEMLGEWESIETNDGTVIYNGSEADYPVFLFDVIGFEYKDTEFVVYVQPWEFDIFSGKVYRITFTKK